jgi:hypothetical protein
VANASLFPPSLVMLKGQITSGIGGTNILGEGGVSRDLAVKNNKLFASRRSQGAYDNPNSLN